MNRLHSLSAVSLALNRGAIGFVVGSVLVTLASGPIDALHPGLSVVFGLVGFAIGAAWGIAYYYRFGYELTDSTFDIASGVVSRRSREIPYRRIQNVDIRQGVLYQLFGLALVTIETAGGGSAEARLNFVSETEADRLQQDIRRLTAETTAEHRSKQGPSASPSAGESKSDDDERADSADADITGDERVDSAGADIIGDERADSADADTIGDEQVPLVEEAEGSPEADRPPEAIDDRDTTERPETFGSSAYQPKKLFELSSRELLLYSFASFRPAAIAAVGFLLFFGSELVIEYLLQTAQPLGGPAALTEGTTWNYVVLSLVSMIHAVVITYLLSILYTFFSYYGFRLGKAGDDLVYERGLAQRYSGSIPLEKVQSVTITDNPIQRRIAHAGLWVETAGYGPSSNGGSQSAVPLARVPRVEQFAARLTGVEAPQFERPPTLARRRYLARYSIIVTILVAAAFGISWLTTFDAWYFVAVLYVLVPPAAHLRWVHLGYYAGAENIVIRSGFWRRRTTVIPYYRVQTISTRQSIFQRRLGLASVVVDTASSQTFVWATPTIHDLYLEDAREIHDESRDRLQETLEARANGNGSIADRL